LNLSEILSFGEDFLSNLKFFRGFLSEVLLFLICYVEPVALVGLKLSLSVSKASLFELNYAF